MPPLFFLEGSNLWTLKFIILASQYQIIREGFTNILLDLLEY